MSLYSQKTYDHATLLKAAGLVAATAAGSVILDLGDGLVVGDLIIDVSAIEVLSNDEIYTVALEGSSVAAMTSLSVTLAEKQLGNVPAPADADTGVGRHVIPFRNEINGVIYRYVRIFTTVVGTIATGINYSAFLAKK